MDQILRSGGEHERKRRRACVLYSGLDAPDGQVVGVDGVAGMPGRIFDGPSDEPERGGLPNGVSASVRVITESVLQVRRERQRRCVNDRRGFASVSSRPIAPSASGLPMENANPALVVASASNPSVVSMLADLASQGLGIAKIPDLSWRDLNASARAD